MSLEPSIKVSSDRELRNLVRHIDPLATHNDVAQVESGIANSLSADDMILKLREAAESNMITNVYRFLPSIFTWESKPINTAKFKYTEMGYNTLRPLKVIYLFARQLGKTMMEAMTGILRASMIPDYKILFVTPLFEQSRRLSNNYCRPLIDNSPFRPLWSGPRIDRSVLQRSFKNGSRLQFTFASTSPDRARGLFVDEVDLDESVRIGTMVKTPSGPVPIELLQVGDLVISFDEEGNICEDEVVDVQDHGVRECFRIELSDGSSVEATGESWFATTAGWKRLETIISDFCSRADVVRDDAGRREHGYQKQEPQVQQSTRPLPTRLQLPKIPGLIRASIKETREGEEFRLRKMVESLVYDHPTMPLAYSLLVSPQRQEVRQPGMAEQVDLGGDSLVVSGRRRTDREEENNHLQYSRIQQEGGNSSCQTSDFHGDTLQGQSSEEPPSRRSILLCDSSFRSVNYPVSGEGQALLGSRDEVQRNSSGSRREPCLSLVSGGIHSFVQSAGLQEGTTSSLLWSEGMSEDSGERSEHQIHQQGRDARTNQAITVGEILRRSREEQREESTGCKKETEDTSISYQRAAAAPPSQSCRGEKSDDSLDMSEMWSGREARKQANQFEVLSGMSDRGDQENQERLREASVVKISCTGKHRVFDIETKYHNTFFAGGVAVHNCQDFQRKFIPIILECLNVSPHKIVQLGCTPKTKDNTASVEFQESSQAEWFIPCGCGKWNIPSIEFDLLNMIGPPSDLISADRPGLICAQCRKPLHPYGLPEKPARWVHRFPGRRYEYSGYHFSQATAPLHCLSSKDWGILYSKSQGGRGYSEGQYHNEVLGEASGIGMQLISEDEVKAACLLPWKNNPNSFAIAKEANLGKYLVRAMGVDWGGGGEEGISLTAQAVGGVLKDGTIDIIWGRKLTTPLDHNREAAETLSAYKAFRNVIFSHDFNGAGDLRETLLLNSSKHLAANIFRAEYGFGGPRVRMKPPDEHDFRKRYRLNRTRCILTVIYAIKKKKIRFFQYDYQNPDERGLLSDFVYLTEEKKKTIRGGDVYTIGCNASFSDDFVHAVTYLCCALWYATKTWPIRDGVSEITPREPSMRLVEDIDPDQPDWQIG